jgi:Ca2+-binding RTX toxin-like protein
MTGGAGDDFMDGGAGADSVDGGGGNDTAVSDVLDTNTSIETLL